MGEPKEEESFLLLKPEAIHLRRTVSLLLHQNGFGLSLVDFPFVDTHSDFASEFYKEHVGKNFFAGLAKQMNSGRVYVIRVTKENAIADLRKLVGSTDPCTAVAGTLRRTFFGGSALPYNGFHTPDSAEACARELRILFPCP